MRLVFVNLRQDRHFTGGKSEPASSQAEQVGEKRLFGRIAATHTSAERSRASSYTPFVFSSKTVAINKMKPHPIFDRKHQTDRCAEIWAKTCPSHLPLSTTVPACPGPPRACWSWPLRFNLCLDIQGNFGPHRNSRLTISVVLLFVDTISYPI